MAERKLSGDWDEKSYRDYLSQGSFIDGTNVMKTNKDGRKRDNSFYGHLKAGSVKASKKMKGHCD